MRTRHGFDPHSPGARLLLNAKRRWDNQVEIVMLRTTVAGSQVLSPGETAHVAAELAAGLVSTNRAIFSASSDASP